MGSLSLIIPMVSVCGRKAALEEEEEEDEEEEEEEEE